MTTIRQHIGDLINYSIKPISFREGDTLTSQSFSYDQVLPIMFLNAQIISHISFLAQDLGPDN